MQCILKTFPAFLNFIRERRPPGFPSTTKYVCGASTANIGGLTTAAFPIRDDSGRIVRWYVLLTDIEDRTRALARLEQMQSDFAHMNRVSMMGELAASLAHEITQPIASARNNARAAQNFLDMQPPDLGEVREALSCVVADADRAGDIIDRIRDHIKKAPPRKDHFDLNEAINEVIVVGAKRNHQEWSLRPNPPDGGGASCSGRSCSIATSRPELDPERSRSDGLGRGGGTRVVDQHRARPGHGVLVAVRDSGPGIDPDHLERVFDAFYTTKSSGVGMGLSICRSIIDAHGGRLWAEANTPRGAVFQFTFPARTMSSSPVIVGIWTVRFPRLPLNSCRSPTVANVGRLGPRRERRWVDSGRSARSWPAKRAIGGRSRLSTHFTTTQSFF